MITCPKCKGTTYIIGPTQYLGADGFIMWARFHCGCCSGTGRVTLLRWIWECHRKELWVAILIILVVISLTLRG